VECDDVKGKLAVVNVGQLVTMAGPARARVGAEMRAIGLWNNVDMIVEGGRVVLIGTREDDYTEMEIDQDTTVIDAGGKLVTPGFVDAHTHLVFAGNRAKDFEKRVVGATYQEIAAAGGGIQSTVELTRAASEEGLFAQTQRHANWMLRGGTTTLEAKSGYGLDHPTELRMLRVLARLAAEGPLRIVPTLLAAHALPKEFAGRRGEYLHWIADELIPEVAALGLAKYCDGFCDDHAFAVDELRPVFTSAKRHGMGMRIHAEQFRPGTGAALAAEMGAATADHLEMVTDETLMHLKDARVQPVLLPASVFCLSRDQYPPARRMIEMGLPVVIATDFNPGSSPAPSMPFTMALACLQMKMLPSEAFTAATINAAYSLGLGNEIGSLEPGKAADFLIHECEDYRELAYYVATPARPRVFIAGSEVTV
jgi:imidazolonepropionase